MVKCFVGISFFFFGWDIFWGWCFDIKNFIGWEGGSEFGGVYVFWENVGLGEFLVYFFVWVWFFVFGVYS